MGASGVAAAATAQPGEGVEETSAVPHTTHYHRANLFSVWLESKTLMLRP